MRFYKQIFYNVASLLPLAFLKKHSRLSTLYPYQHTVSDRELLHIKHLYPYKNVRQFEKDLDFLLKHFKPVSPGEVIKEIQDGRKSSTNSFLLSFDDGFRETEEIIAPILHRKGVPAVFFINPAFIDNKELFYRCKISLIIQEILDNGNKAKMIKACSQVFKEKSPGTIEELLIFIRKINNLNSHLLDELARELELSFDNYLQVQQPFLTTKQVERLVSMGFAIGGHSWDHPYYSLLSLIEQLRQTESSLAYVRDKFYHQYSLFSFPHSDERISQLFFDQLCQNNNVVDLFFGTQNQKYEVKNNVMHRFNSERPSIPFEKQINGILLLALLRRFSGRESVVRN